MEIKEIFNQLKRKIYENKNTSLMLGGRLIAQAVPILLTPLFTRIYSPEEFGYFGAYVTIVSIIAMLSNGRYCLAIMLPKEQSKAQRLVWISILLTSISTIIFALILLFAGMPLFSALNISTLNNYILTLVLSVLFIGVYEAIFYYFLREKRYKEIATNIIIQAGFLVLARLGAGFFKYTEGGLMYSYLVSYLVGTFLFLIMSRKDIAVFAKEKFEESIFKLMSMYSKFPKYSLFADLLKNFTFLSPNLFLNKAFGAVSAGYYALSDKILGSPVWFLTSSFGDVLKQEASEQFRETGSCVKVVRQTSKTLFLIGIIPFTLLFIFAPMVVPFVFGAQWEPAGRYIRIFTLMYFARFVVDPITDVLYVIEKQSVKIWFELMKLVALVIGFVIGFIARDAYLGFLAWSSITSVVYVICFFISYRLSKGANVAIV